ncbi:hypothetical protein HYV50_03995 [Candidatus Pacearchaeota archaeon]|nr:hypothetical protein [Candidatus Pacearchaeota archaeon]
MSLESRIKEAKFRVIPHVTESAAMNLAIDRALLEKMEKKLLNGDFAEPIIRTYQLNRPAVILGYNQKSEGRFNHDLANENNVDLTMRDSGGGHMYFSPKDIHFSFISPLNFFDSRDLISMYWATNSILLNALRKIGYDAHLGRTSIRIGDANGLIIAGAARKNKRFSSLQQVGILVGNYDKEIFDILMARKDEIKLWKKRVWALEKFGELDRVNLVKNLIRSLPNYFVKDLNYDETNEAKRLCKTVYTNSEVLTKGTKLSDICLIADYKKDKEEPIIEYAAA